VFYGVFVCACGLCVRCVRAVRACVRVVLCVWCVWCGVVCVSFDDEGATCC
jgi:hypothetical protein